MPSKKSGIAIATASAVLLAGAGLVVKKWRRGQHGAAVSAESAAQTLRIAKPLEAADAVEVIYDGQLGSGWSDWGWGSHDLPNHAPAKIAFSGYGGIILQHASVQKRVSAFSFRFNAPEDWGDFLSVSLKLAGGQESLFKTVTIERRHIAQLPGGFREVLIPWRELNPTNAPFDRAVISATRPVGTQPVLLDKIFLVASSAATEVAEVAPTRSVELEIACAAEAHPINPSIYGSAGGDWGAGLTGARLGGNPVTRLNWDLGQWNTGNDWFFENAKGLVVKDWLGEVKTHGGRAAVTVPMIGWVAKDGTSVGFPASKFAKQRKFDPYRKEAGDGYVSDDKPITPGPQSETSIAAPPELIGRWVKALHDEDQAHTVEMFILDNEPSLWNTTHRDVHPDPLTYDELMDRTVRYATEVRRAAPDAKIAGPAEWGWLGYFYSAKDRSDGKFVRSDRRAHGDEPLIPWYLKQLAQYEKEHGTRLLDVLDVHFYPAADGMYGGNAKTDADAAELRIRSTRALWDDSYVDESWIAEPIRLIPRLKEWVAANYPGLSVSLGEWSFGADAHISGGLATAEALGRFGQQGLDAAYYWQGPAKDTAAFWAFRAYRNFDGKGGRFLDWSVPTRETEKVSLFASRDGERDHFVAVLVNRDPVFAAAAHVGVGACGRVTSQRVFGYEAGSKDFSERPNEPARSDKLSATLPPYSITVLDIRVEPPTP